MVERILAEVVKPRFFQPIFLRQKIGSESRQGFGFTGGFQRFLHDKHAEAGSNFAMAV